MFANRETLTEQIARHLGQQIIFGQYQPGQKLRELEIARELEVSSNTVREAFHIVEKRHLVNIEPRRGAFVAELTPARVKHLYDFMFILFTELARRAAVRWRDGDPERFAALVQRLGTHLREDDKMAFQVTAFEFVHAALEFADNSYLEQALDDLLPELQRCSYIALQANTSEIDLSFTLFQRIVENMLRRDAEATALAARTYGENQCRIVLAALAARETPKRPGNRRR